MDRPHFLPTSVNLSQSGPVYLVQVEDIIARARQATGLFDLGDSAVIIPSYGDWFLHRASYLPAFAFHKQLLQLLQAENGGRWTLKNPWHPLFLNDLLTTYPDAQFVMTHRDPA